MAKGFIHISTSQNGDVLYYAREQECTYVLSSANLSSHRSTLLKEWQAIEKQEKLGNKELGIRGRHDAQVRKNYILSLPNEVSPQEGAERIKTMLDKTPIARCSYSIFIHKGEKNGVVNQHAHVVVNERNLATHQKDREMIKKVFLEKTFRPLFEAEFAREREQGKDLVPRERIEEQFFHADLAHSQALISSLQPQQVPQVNQAEWQQLFEDYANIAEKKELEEREALEKKLAAEELSKQKLAVENQPSPNKGLSL